MRIPRIWIWMLLPGAVGLAAENSGTVTLPLSRWEQIVDEIATGSPVSEAQLSYCIISRSVKGNFNRGLFQGILTSRFTVYDSSGHIRVPVIDGSASLGTVTLNNRRTSLHKKGNMFTIGINTPGDYTVRARILIGREMDRFERRLDFTIPDAGPTKISVTIPEKNIEAQLKNGALTGYADVAGGTTLHGYLDPHGRVDITWRRRLSHTFRKEIKSEGELYTLFTIEEALVSGNSLVKIHITEGETDRFDFRIPDNIEILDVTGDSVLQWRTHTGTKDDTAGAATGRLVVLLRHLVQERVAMNITFQFPAEEGKNIRLKMPYADTSMNMRGALGILGAAGLNVKVIENVNTEVKELRDLPHALTSMSTSPFLYGFTFLQPPSLTLGITRHKTVALTGTLVDDLQASTVVIENGFSITKLKMRIRNNTRQYLKMTLPPNALLTHSMIDGMPVRPASADSESKDVLLFPLQQSEPIGGEQMRYHTVRPGETLSDIANIYYSDPENWSMILNNNTDQIAYAEELMQGQVLKIPPRQGIKVQESSFLIELAYKTSSDHPLGFAGSRNMRLPEIDIETMKATWHLYLPKMYDILNFKGNMTQLSSIRYTMFRRLRDFFRRGLWQKAWAGGNARYYNILKQRKAIYKEDYANKVREEAVLASFPLVGRKYRFRRDLLGTDTPAIRFTYTPKWVAVPMRILAFLGAAVLVFLFLHCKRNKRNMVIYSVLFLILIIFAHYFLGMHRRILWGIDVGLFIHLLKSRLSTLRPLFSSWILAPWRSLRIISWINIGIMLGAALYFGFILSFPFFFSTSLCILLLLIGRLTHHIEKSAEEVPNV